MIEGPSAPGAFLFLLERCLPLSAKAAIDTPREIVRMVCSAVVPFQSSYAGRAIPVAVLPPLRRVPLVRHPLTPHNEAYTTGRCGRRSNCAASHS